jgi:DGQHR domain-containing protein
MNCRDANGLVYEETQGGIGNLKIKSRLWLVDGQHRIAGLELAASKDGAFADYSIPVVILSGQDRNSEMEHFFVINDRQKGVPVDLVLRFLVAKNGNSVPGDRDATLAITVTDMIALDRSSCWFRRIQLTNEPRLKSHTITERSFHRALLPAVRVPSFRRSEPKKAASVIANYWNALRDIVPESFADPRRYLIMRTVGAYTMNMVFPHIFDICLRKGSFSQANFLEVLLKTGIDSEDWTRESVGSYAGIVGFQKLAEKYVQRLPDAKLPLR